MGSSPLFAELPDHWETPTLGEIVKRGGGSIQTGPFGSQLHASDYVDVGIPSIMPVNIGDNRLIEDGIARITEEDAQRLSKHRVRIGDIIYSRRGDVERRAIVREGQEGWFCGTGCLKVRLGEGVIDPDFASFYLGHPAVRGWIVNHAVGATMPNLNTGIMERVPFVLPPLSEQRAIAEVLGALDDKIALNRRMNRTLESMARALFKSWFVDFDPVHANAAGTPSLPSDLAALFPATFEPSPLGEKPEGWEVASFSDHIKAVRGLSYKGKGLCGVGEGLPMHNLNSIYEGGGYKHEGIKYYAGDYKDKHVLRAGDMIITNTEQGHEHRLIGHAAIVPDRFGDTGLFSHHIYRITPKKDSHLTRHYLYYLFNTDRWHKMIAGYSNGTSINMLPLDVMKMPLLVVPPAKLVEHFDALARDVAAKIEQGHEQSHTLAAVRDALLPKLLGGELPLRKVV